MTRKFRCICRDLCETSGPSCFAVRGFRLMPLWMLPLAEESENHVQQMDIFSVPWLSIADGLPQVPSRPVEFKLVAGGDSRQICSSCGLAPSFWLTSPRLWNQAFSLSCPLFSELHPALDIPGHSHVHNASLKAGLIEIL